MDNNTPTIPLLVTQQKPNNFRVIILLLVGLVMFVIGLGIGYLIFGNKNNVVQAPNQAAQLTPTVAPVAAPTNTTTFDIKTGWRDYENQYFRLQYPNTWRFVDEPNKGKNELALYHLMQSASENDGTPMGNYYDIHILSNTEGKDVMTFAKSDILANWQQDSRPTYEAYPLKNLDAVVVKNIISGIGA